MGPKYCEDETLISLSKAYAVLHNFIRIWEGVFCELVGGLQEINQPFLLKKMLIMDSTDYGAHSFREITWLIISYCLQEQFHFSEVTSVDYS